MIKRGLVQTDGDLLSLIEILESTDMDLVAPSDDRACDVDDLTELEGPDGLLIQRSVQVFQILTPWE